MCCKWLSITDVQSPTLTSTTQNSEHDETSNLNLVMSTSAVPDDSNQQEFAAARVGLLNLVPDILKLSSLAGVPGFLIPAVSVLNDIYEHGVPLSWLLQEPLDKLGGNTAFEYEIIRCSWQEPRGNELLDFMLDHVAGDRDSLEWTIRKACLRRVKDANGLFQYMLRRIARADCENIAEGDEMSTSNISQGSLQYEIVRNDLDDEEGFDMSFSIVEFVNTLKRMEDARNVPNQEAMDSNMIQVDPPPSRYAIDPAGDTLGDSANSSPSSARNIKPELEAPTISLQFIASSHAWSLDVGRDTLQLKMLDGEATSVDARAIVVVHPLSGSTSPALTTREVELFDLGVEADMLTQTISPQEEKSMTESLVGSFVTETMFSYETDSLRHILPAPTLEFSFPTAILYPVSESGQHRLMLRSSFSDTTPMDSSNGNTPDDLKEFIWRSPTSFDDPSSLNDDDELLLRLSVKLQRILPIESNDR